MDPKAVLFERVIWVNAVLRYFKNESTDAVLESLGVQHAALVVGIGFRGLHFSRILDLDVLVHRCRDLIDDNEIDCALVPILDRYAIAA